MQLGETAVAVASGVVSAASVAPLLYAADRAVTEAAAAGAARGARAAPAAAQLAGAFASALRGLVKAPLSPALMMVVGGARSSSSCDCRDPNVEVPEYIGDPPLLAMSERSD